MSAYATDPRVTATKYMVQTPKGWCLVTLQGGLGGRWVVSRSNKADEDFATSDDAIRSLIGEPQ